MNKTARHGYIHTLSVCLSVCRSVSVCMCGPVGRKRRRCVGGGAYVGGGGYMKLKGPQYICTLSMDSYKIFGLNNSNEISAIAFRNLTELKKFFFRIQRRPLKKHSVVVSCILFSVSHSYYLEYCFSPHPGKNN